MTARLIVGTWGLGAGGRGRDTRGLRMTVYDNTEIFAGGGCELEVQTQGLLVVPSLRMGGSDGRMVNLGPLDLVIVARGVIIGATSSELWGEYDALAGMISDPPRVATLVEDSGREWVEMGLVSVRATGAVQSGRVKSLACEATFVRFQSV